jgi:hypothetical protein
MQLTPQELELLQILSDPVMFAKHHFNWEARWYQKEMLNNQSLRKISRCGRRIGKTDTLCVHMLWYAFTHSKSVCLVAAPYENQVKLIFKRVREFMKESPEILQSVTQNTKHPEYIEFGNGSVIAGFTAGTKSGAAGGSIRGQRANWIYLDETDYLSDDDIYTITAIGLENKSIGIWASSTPSGKRGKFYEWCLDAQHGIQDVPPGTYTGKVWTASYFPSTVLPDWDEEQEKEWRISLTEDAWDHEVMANFGQEAIGVFNKEYLDRAKRDYAYIENPENKAIRVIGVDWDKYQATPQIVVMEYCPSEINSQGEMGMFKIINRDSVPRSEFTLDNAVQKIIDFNGIYRPSFIYVDRGFGEYQIEILRKAGKQCKDPRANEFGLDKIVVGVNGNENVIIRDPATNEKVKKPAKPFMVNQTVIVLERDRLILNENDKVLWRQMENYQVVRRSVDGRPTFTSVDEHTVDGLMLCIMAFTIEFPQITKIIEKFEPTRILGIAPPIKTPEPSFNKPLKKKKQEDEEYFVTQGARERSTQTWFRVKDLRQERQKFRGFSSGQVAPRGRSSSKPFSRPKI